MKESRQGTKPADPQLEAGRPKDALRPFGIPRWLGAGLFVLFSFVLVVPLVRRWRRERWWTVVRASFAFVGASLAGAWALGEAGVGAWVAGAVLIGLAVWLSPLTDPDFERKLQRQHRADYLMNGGVLVEGSLAREENPGAQDELYFLVRSPHLMVVPKSGAGDVIGSLDIRRIERIEVDGETYVPVYVSEAKDPPVREVTVDQSATSDLEIAMDDGQVLQFRYRGAFHKHLAETAAHGVYSVREGLRSAGKPEGLRVLGA